MSLLNRYIDNPILSRLGRLFFKSPIGDFHCGLRSFHASSIRQLKLRSKGMEFASEMVVKATLKQLKMIEILITLFRDGRNHASHLRKWRDSFRHLKLLVLLKLTGI